MGVMRFQVFPPSRISGEMLQRVYLSGMDRVAWPSRALRTSDGLAIERAVSDSGNLHVPWPVSSYGELTLATGSLMERDRPYHLQVELARGKVNQVRSQLADWQAIGLAAPQPLLDRIHEAIQTFSLAACSQHEPMVAAEHAERAIDLAVQAGVILGATFTEQALQARYRHATKLGTHLGVNLGQAPLEEHTAKLVRAGFNTAVVPMSWSQVEAQEAQHDWSVSDAQIEWCAAEGLSVFAGPLLPLDSFSLPDWLYLWEGDFDNILSFLTGHIERTVNRYRGKVQVWVCASRVNVSKELGLSEVDTQRLAVRAIELVRRLDPNTPAILGCDQPWAEYMNREELEPPLYFADLLTRANVGLSGIGLEINLGYYPGGSYPRDLLDFSLLIDRWSFLGIPLYLFLTVPSGHQPDPLAQHPATPPAGSTHGSQNLWVNRFLPLFLAKPAVQAVVWNQLLDSQPHQFPHGGLFDAAASPKAALSSLATLRRAHLQ